MNEELFVEVQAAIFEMGQCFSKHQQPTEQMINAYAKVLINFTPDQIMFAFGKVFESGSAFFPSVSEILQHLKPKTETKEDKAPLIANEIIAFVRLCSFDLEHRYIHTLPGETRLILEAIGGTKSIRSSENFETMKAQLERSIKGALSRGLNQKANSDLMAIGIEIPKEGKLLEFAGYLSGA